MITSLLTGIIDFTHNISNLEKYVNYEIITTECYKKVIVYLLFAHRIYSRISLVVLIFIEAATYSRNPVSYVVVTKA